MSVIQQEIDEHAFLTDLFLIIFFITVSPPEHSVTGSQCRNVNEGVGCLPEGGPCLDLSL